MLTVNVEAEFDPARLRHAVAHLESAVRADPKNVRYRKVLAEGYLSARRFDAAMEQLRAVWQHRPDPRVAYLLAFTLYRLGELDEAEELLDQVGHDESVGFSRRHELAGRILHDREHYAEAVNQFSQALMLSPDSPGPKWHMARSLVAHAETKADDRLSLFRRALGLLKSIEPRPGQEDAWHETLGRVYLALHQPVEALRHLERTMQSGSAEKSLLLGLAWLLRGEDDKGRPYLREAARNAEMRPQAAAYLSEIATTPRHLLQRMGLKTGRGGFPVFLDHEYLGTIFGKDALEVLEIINAGTKPRQDLMSRTQAEADPDRRSARHLFAPAEEQGARAEAGGDPETAGNEQATRMIESSPRSSGDRLFPKTMIEVAARADAGPGENEEAEVEATIEFEEDDWDIGLDEGAPIEKTSAMPIEEIDDEDQK